jgi:GDPmannose 4,6-dehydratase
MAKRALVTGIYGQDAAYLAKLLLSKGYEVIGAARRNASGSSWRLQELGVDKDVRIVDFELLEQSNIMRTVEKIQADEIYNLAAQSFVGTSFNQPLYTAEVDALGVVRLLEAIRAVGKGARFYQASTSELYGNSYNGKQSETTPFYPCSPYAVAKLYAHWMTINYRKGYDMYACCGILFNHESPLRGTEFVTRKITHTLAQIKYGQADCLELGNLHSKRDWGFAADYVDAMWRMLQQDKADDFVIATGETHTVHEFVNLAAARAGFDLAWEGEEENMRAIDRKTNKVVVRVNLEFFRPVELHTLIGDASKAAKALKWTPKVFIEGLVEMMVDADLRRVFSSVKSLKTT